MKTIVQILSRVVVILIFMSTYATSYGQNDNESFYTLSGQLKDAKTGEKISYATIAVPGSGIGTVSNIDGEFTLKVAKALKIDIFEVSHLSYATTKFKISESLGKDKIFYIEPQYVLLKEISIIPQDARRLVEMAMKSVKKNYSEVPNMMTGFYRETVKQKRDYLSISEAVIDIYKAPYGSYLNDQVRIFKGRKGTNVKKADTLMVQLQGGPNVSMLLDIVKNTDLSIALDNLDNYLFEFGSIVNIDDKPNWVVNFSPNIVREEPLYFGKLYIAQESMAITRVEFSLDLNDQDKASRVFVQKKPMGLVFMPVSTNYLVTYKEQSGKFYLNYVRVDLKFRCDWNKKVFKEYFSIMSEVAITDRHEDNVAKFPNQDVFKYNMVFAEKVQNFTDPDFWGEYNIIEPEESIVNAIKRI